MASSMARCDAGYALNTTCDRKRITWLYFKKCRNLDTAHDRSCPRQ
ncbi:hypothetical protein KPSA1_00054 [Pseudomonas syringae pv. actinidiae]|uniref:Uncharacterized protein n=1 Tax=Pseudomonas syringae pv. actinidiae TaxID=103796 RepID=A0A2V0Q339_PSESF|nr:hypothetical protein KPSA1_00054 [Pseudomonas syringae pv. actinidiae]